MAELSCVDCHSTVKSLEHEIGIARSQLQQLS